MNSDASIYVVDNEQRTTDAIVALATGMGLDCRVFASGLKLLDEIDLDRPGCLISEIRIPDIGGLQLQRRLREMDATTPVIFLTAYSSVQVVVRAMKAGAFHFLEKPFDEHSIWEVIQDAICFDQESCRKKHERRGLERRMAELTKPEREVLDFVLQGMPNRGIAEKQDVSVRTVELRRGRVMDKLGASTLAELVRIGLLANRRSDNEIRYPDPVYI